MKRSRPDKSKTFKFNFYSFFLFLIKDLLDTTMVSPRRVAVPVLIRNGRPCHQQRFSIPSSPSVSNQHIHGQSTTNSNSSLVVSSKNDNPPTIPFNDRQHMKCDNIDLFQQLIFSQMVLSKKFYFPTTT